MPARQKLYDGNGPTMNDLTEQSVSDGATFGAGWKIRLGVLIAMLVLALAGLGFTLASETGDWEFWLFIVLVYAALGLWRSLRSAQHTAQSISKSVVREVAHWGNLVGFLAVRVIREIIDRQSALYFALMMLTRSCCMAGVHIDWVC